MDWDKAIDEVMKMHSEISVLYGEARILIQCGRLLEGAECLNKIGAMYMRYADMLVEKSKEIANG